MPERLDLVSGGVHVEHVDGVERVTAREGTSCAPVSGCAGSTPVAAEYLALCVPAFALPRVERTRPDFGAPQRRRSIMGARGCGG